MTSDEAVSRMIDHLERGGTAYMIVGSLSSNIYGVARSTKDADIVVETGSQSVAALLKGLPADFRLDPQVTFESVTGTLRYLIDVAGLVYRIELFRLSSDPHDQERFARRLRLYVPDAGREAFVPTPEDVIITKLRWAANAAQRYQK